MSIDSITNTSLPFWLIGEYDSTGQPINEYIWLNGIPVGLSTNHAIYAIHTDHLGTPRAVTNAQQQTVWRWSIYDEPFGAAPADTIGDTDDEGGAIDFHLRFPGQYYDPESGLHYNYFRDYDPSTGRYVESDPIGLDGGFNTFEYAISNPIILIDPRGLVVCSCTEGPLRGFGYSPDGVKICSYLCECPCKEEVISFDVPGLGIYFDRTESYICLGQKEGFDNNGNYLGSSYSSFEIDTKSSYSDQRKETVKNTIAHWYSLQCGDCGG